MKKLISVLLTCILLISSSSICTFSKNNKQKMKLSHTEILDLMIGKTTTIKLENPKGKVKWSVEYNNVIKIVKKKGKKNQSIKIKAVSLGQSYVYARVNGKKLKCYVNVVDEYFSFKSLKKVYIDKGERYAMSFQADLLDEDCINKTKRIKVISNGIPCRRHKVQRLKKNKWVDVPIVVDPQASFDCAEHPLTESDYYNFTTFKIGVLNTDLRGEKAGRYRYVLEADIYFGEADKEQYTYNPIKRTYYAYFKIKDYEFTL